MEYFTGYAVQTRKNIRRMLKRDRKGILSGRKDFRGDIKTRELGV